MTTNIINYIRKNMGIMKSLLPTASCGVVLTMGLLLASCDADVFNINADPFKDSMYVSDLEAPISEYLSTQENLSEYVKALKYADLYNALNQSSDGTSFTALVPNNDAMHEFYQRRGVDSLQQLSEEYVKAFILYHTVKDSITADKFITKTSLTNLSNDGISLAMDSLNAGQIKLNNEGQVVEMGISAYNGTIYILSKAMTPLVETVYDRVAQLGTSNIMCEALQETGWAKELNTLADTTVVDGSKVTTKRYYTLLNVTDETFGKAGISSLASLKTKLAASDQRGVGADSLLREYVAYHVLQNSYSISSLFASSGSSLTRIWGTSAKNQVFTITHDTLTTVPQQMYTFNASAESAQLDMACYNVRARNGYLHNITSWLPVWEPKQETVIWDLADYSEIKALVPSSVYQPSEAPTSEDRYRITNAACFNAEVTDTKNTTYSEIDYVPCKRYTLKDAKQAYNWDRVVFNVGYMGSVEMSTPTLVRGKYKVELSIVYTTTHSFMRLQSDGTGGRLRLTIDDANTIYTAPYTKVTSALPGVYTSTLYDEIEFDETSAHTLKFVVLDPAASTNKNFSLQFDCITFTPIE